MFINKNLMEAVSAAGGAGLVSKASAPMSLLSNQVPMVGSAIAKAQSKGGVDLTALITAKGGWDTKVGMLSSYVKASESAIAYRMGVATEYRQLTQVMSGELAQGCMDYLGVSGIGLGMFNELFDAVTSKLSELAAKLEAYAKGLLGAGELSAFITRMLGEVNSAIAAVQAAIDAEKAKLDEMLTYLKQSAFVQGLSALWNNPCTQTLAREVMPPTYAAALDNPSISSVRAIAPEWPAHLDI